MGNIHPVKLVVQPNKQYVQQLTLPIPTRLSTQPPKPKQPATSRLPTSICVTLFLLFLYG
jgi:hypothetical protein